MIISTDFFVLGSNLVSYAVENNNATNNKNIEFSAYFKDSNGNKTEKLSTSIKAENLKLYAEIVVKNDGYFNGELELLPYIIDENGFKIPVRCKVNNLSVDDVSNCSTSEKSMIAVIMSFALAFHSSQIYNIVRLDEVDGGLDQANRAMFPVILDAICRTLDISQTFIISHSSESDMTNVDIISLTPVSNETLRGNVIFQL